jgi:hypothetical protein
MVIDVQVSEIEFQFKGERSYIHGTDIFNAMLDNYSIATIGSINFTMHDFVRTPTCQLYLIESKTQLNKLNEVCARCELEVNGTKHWLALTQCRGDVTSGGRYEYDEEQINTLCSLQGECIVLSKLSNFTFIENIVAMNKYLHQHLYPGVVGKWIFTRINLKGYCDSREKLELQLRHNMNYRLTKTDVLVEGKKIGDIYYSLMQS